MRIISQKGLAFYDLPYDKCTISLSTDGKDIYAVYNIGACKMASYSDPEKTEMVIRKLYNQYSHIWKIGNGLDGYFGDQPVIFRFPQEDEI